MKLIYSKHLHNSKYMILGSLNTSLFDHESDQYRHILEIVMDFDMEESLFKRQYPVHGNCQ